MRFFARFFRQRPEKRGSRTRNGAVPIDPRLVPLEMAVFVATTEASKAVKAGWADLGGEPEVPAESDWCIRVEALGFFLHIVNRYSVKFGGEEARAFIQDRLTIQLVNQLVDTSWDDSNVEPTSDRGQTVGALKTSALDSVGDAEMEYAQCSTAFETPYGELAPTDADVTGRFARRIAECTGHDDDDGLRFLVWSSTVQAHGTSQLRSQVDSAIRSLNG